MNDLVMSETRGTMRMLVLNQPGQRNPLDRETSTVLRDLLRAAFVDDSVRSIAITGSGDAFCAGGNLRQMAEFADIPVEESYRWPQAIVDLHKDMLSAPKPVVAAVNGPAFAGGMGLAGMCDVIVAAESATFAMPEVKLGLFPMIIVGHLARSIPRKILLEMMLTGDPIDAQEAYRIGFANRVVGPGAMDEALAGYAERFARASPQAIKLGRKTFTLLADMPVAQSLDAAQFLNLPFFLGADLAEGVDAFLGRRAPSWIPSEEGLS